MDRATFNTFCEAMPATSHVVQWGNADVWKVGPKVFAICGWADGRDAFTFKVYSLENGDVVPEVWKAGDLPLAFVSSEAHLLLLLCSG